MATSQHQWLTIGGSLDDQATPALLDSLYLYYTGESWEFDPAGQPFFFWRRYVRFAHETSEQFYHRVINKCNLLNMCSETEEFTPNYPELTEL